MEIIFRLQGVDFEWDQDKATSNYQKHGITFEEAAEVFFDPFHRIGDASVDEEQRDFIIGYTISQRLLLVVYLERKERVRLVSARQATRIERKTYEEA